jgi:hypothetical protein
MPAKIVICPSSLSKIITNRFKVSRFKVQGPRFKVQGSRFEVQGFTFDLSPFSFYLVLYPPKQNRFPGVPG